VLLKDQENAITGDLTELRSEPLLFKEQMNAEGSGFQCTEMTLVWIFTSQSAAVIIN